MGTGLLARSKRLLHTMLVSEHQAIPLFQRVVIELQSHCNRTCFFCCREGDASGKRKTVDGKSVVQSMPSERVKTLFDELVSMGFSGYITFHHLSEAFLDKRLISFARDAKDRGMKPYIHTNGDVLRNDHALCREAAEVFEYIVIGLYDYKTEEEKQREKEFWRGCLVGTEVMFSLVEKIYVRTHSPRNSEMDAIGRQTHPNAVCADPETYLLIHYNGDVACCCEDMHGELLKMNIFETSIREVWYSTRHHHLIKALQAGDRKQFPLCAKCTMGPSYYLSDPMQITARFDR